MRTTYTIRPASPALGAWVRDLDLAALMAQADGQRVLGELLCEHQVLFLPDQQISARQFEQLARSLGPLHEHGAYPGPAEAPALQVLESTAERPSKIERWHTDMTFSATPPPITLLHAQVIPPVGGDTLWCSTAAAYDALSPPVQGFLETLRAEHDFRHGFRESLSEPGGPERLAASIASNPPVAHPVVFQHPQSGRRCLYVNELFTTRILGLSATESAALLDFLFAHLRDERFALRLRWAPQLVAIWDNRSTQHKPINDYYPAHRRHLRATVARLRD